MRSIRARIRDARLGLVWASQRHLAGWPAIACSALRADTVGERACLAVNDVGAPYVEDRMHGFGRGPPAKPGPRASTRAGGRRRCPAVALSTPYPATEPDPASWPTSLSCCTRLTADTSFGDFCHPGAGAR